MIIVSGNSHISLAKKIGDNLNTQITVSNTKRFEDQELKIQIDKNLYEQEVVIVQSTSKPSNDHLMELLLIADTAKRSGAKRITALIPYFGYSRQDRHSYNYGPISASLVARLIEASGVDKVITMDLHSKQSEGFFKSVIKNIDPIPLFIPFLKNEKYTIVSPDIGGISRARSLSGYLKTDLVVINKSRNFDGTCIMSEVIGDVRGKKCILIDDIVDTASTLCNAANLLKEKGAKSVGCFVTHAVFSRDSIYLIEQTNFDQFYVTNTIKHENLPNHINIIDVSEILSNSICNK